jgi:hypothetical protein
MGKVLVSGGGGDVDVEAPVEALPGLAVDVPASMLVGGQAQRAFAGIAHRAYVYLAGDPVAVEENPEVAGQQLDRSGHDLAALEQPIAVHGGHPGDAVTAVPVRPLPRDGAHHPESLGVRASPRVLDAGIGVEVGGAHGRTSVVSAA